MSPRRPLFITAAAILVAATPSVASSVHWSPAWLSIESPVNPYDAATRGAVLLVRAQLQGGDVQLTDLAATAEGLVQGVRRSIPLRLDATSRTNIFALRRQWPDEGVWLVRIGLAATTAIVTFDAGGIATARVATESSTGMPLPRAVSTREIDSMLTTAHRK